jgi:hypothetical protein
MGTKEKITGNKTKKTRNKKIVELIFWKNGTNLSETRNKLLYNGEQKKYHKE